MPCRLQISIADWIKMKIAVIDYKMSNMFSIKNALDFLGFDCRVTSDPKVILDADGAVFPGVGAFPEAMQNLYDLKLVEVIKEFVSRGKPFIGICLGLQLLFNQSDEFQNCEGLNLIDGKVEDLSQLVIGLSVPHVGWNKVVISKTTDQFNSLQSRVKINNQDSYYFVHSHFVNPKKIRKTFSLLRIMVATSFVLQLS